MRFCETLNFDSHFLFSRNTRVFLGYYVQEFSLYNPVFIIYCRHLNLHEHVPNILCEILRIYAINTLFFRDLPLQYDDDDAQIFCQLKCVS